MTLRYSLKKLIRRDPVSATLRERAAELRGSLSRSATVPAEMPALTHAERVAQAGANLDVLALAGIDHRDGTVSYADAAGKVSRHPMARWIAFNAMQMHSHVQAEIGRRRIIEANSLPGDEREEWEARIRRELRADAVSALTFNPQRAFKAEELRRSGAEPMTADLRAVSDADLIALLPVWEAARDAYAEASERCRAISHAADGIERPPSRDLPHEERLRLVAGWHERTGVEDAEGDVDEALDELSAIEDRIADLSAASLAGLRLKALVAQRNEDIDVGWPDKLGEGLARDLLVFTEVQAAPPKPAIGISLVDQIDLASATMDELRALHDVADLVGGVTYAVTWQGRCKARGGGDRVNAAGKLMQWLGDALTSVETAANEEAYHRIPSNGHDRERRLAMRAPITIDNGDSDQIEAFARELLAHVQAGHEDR